MGGKLHSVVILKIRLQNHFSRRLPASGSAGNLRQQLKGALGRAEIGKAQCTVGANHTNQRDAVNVVALCNHLRADENIELTFIQRVERALEILMPADGVAIEPRNARLREDAVQEFFQLLGAGAEKIHVLTAAVNA